MSERETTAPPSIGASGEGPQRQEPTGGGLAAGTTDPAGGLVGDEDTLDSRSDYAEIGRAADGLGQGGLPPGTDSTRDRSEADDE
jgi:hypothetical protein